MEKQIGERYKCTDTGQCYGAIIEITEKNKEAYYCKTIEGIFVWTNFGKFSWVDNHLEPIKSPNLIDSFNIF